LASASSLSASSLTHDPQADFLSFSFFLFLLPWLPSLQRRLCSPVLHILVLENQSLFEANVSRSSGFSLDPEGSNSPSATKDERECCNLNQRRKSRCLLSPRELRATHGNWKQASTGSKTAPLYSPCTSQRASPSHTRPMS